MLPFLMACFLLEAWPAQPFYKIGDTWKYDYFYESNWMAGTMVTTQRGWTRIEITSVVPTGDTLRYGYRAADSGVSKTENNTTGMFGYAGGNYFLPNAGDKVMDLSFFARELNGLKKFTVRYGADTLEFLTSDQSWDTYEYLDAWGPVHSRIQSSGGHTSLTWERNLLEHNGVPFTRSGLVMQDTLHVGVTARRTGNAGAGWKGWNRLVRVFHGRAVDGRSRARE